LRTSSLAKGNGAIRPLGVVHRSIEHAPEAAHSAQVKFTLLLKAENRQAAFDLPLSQDLIEQLALEATVRDQTIVGLMGRIVRRVLEKDLVGELLRNGNSPPKLSHNSK
jgi:hypothetical protein